MRLFKKLLCDFSNFAYNSKADSGNQNTAHNVQKVVLLKKNCGHTDKNCHHKRVGPKALRKLRPLTHSKVAAHTYKTVERRKQIVGNSLITVIVVDKQNQVSEDGFLSIFIGMLCTAVNDGRHEDKNEKTYKERG